MIEVADRSDDELRAELFTQLVERLEAAAGQDGATQVFNRTPSEFSLSRHGNLLTVSQGARQRLLRGELTWKRRPENGDPSWKFGVSRAANPSLLVWTPEGQDGTAEELLDAIVKAFLEKTER